MSSKPFTPVDSTRPIYRPSTPGLILPDLFEVDSKFIDLTNIHLQPFDESDPVTEANIRFDLRAAAAVANATENLNANFVQFVPSGSVGGRFVPEDRYRELLEMQSYEDAPDVFIPQKQSLALVAYPNYFPFDGARAENSSRLVSEAILAANPGWCGSFGPGVDSATDFLKSDLPEGNYDMSEMHMLQIAYRYYDRLSPAAQEHLIRQLLARGCIHRPGLDDTFTSGGNPNDWRRAGMVSPAGRKIEIGETENHILMIVTARYLTNQLLFQRTSDPVYDNRRNGTQGPHCTDLILSLLRNILRDDFSEYNAKNYQTETRYALLNLCSYAYDHEVRLGARMVLDYISAHVAVSSCDLRRMVPFRRRNEKQHVTHDIPRGFMTIGLVESSLGSDPNVQHYMMLAGNTRIYETRGWHISTFNPDPDTPEGNDCVMDAVGDYRLPLSIHDLFVNDAHRRFYQRLHRKPLDNTILTARNCDNQEIYAGSPSYLISAGGAFATWAIDPGPVQLSAKLRRKNDQQLGVAMPTSFMPTMRPQGDCGDPTSAADLIQFGRFSDVDGVFNYGVAPNFACGPKLHIPYWCDRAIQDAIQNESADSFGKFQFVDRGSAGTGPGFYLAIFQDGDFAIMEAFDTWVYPKLNFRQFMLNVYVTNKDLTRRGLHSNVSDTYTTQNGTRIAFVIRDEKDYYGAEITNVDFTHSRDAGLELYGNASQSTGFLNGTVMNSGPDGVITITNHPLGTGLTLDMADQRYPKRTSETGEVEEAGSQDEMWVDFAWPGPFEGDFFRPFNNIPDALQAVADPGVIRIKPGVTTNRAIMSTKKRVRIIAPVGGVAIGMSQ